MTDRKKTQPTRTVAKTRVSPEREAEIYRVFKLMRRASRSDSGYINPRQPRMSLLEPTPNIVTTTESVRKRG